LRVTAQPLRLFNRIIFNLPAALFLRLNNRCF